MNPDEFWPNQLKKNESGSAKYFVDTEPETPEDEFMGKWIEKWHEHFSYFDNTGCGCCINMYEFDAPPEAVAEIPVQFITGRVELNPSIRRKTQSSFKEFNHKIAKQNDESR